MKRIIVILAIVLSLSSISYGAEQLDLSPAVVCNAYRMTQLFFDWTNQIINVSLTCVQTGEIKQFSYTGGPAQTLMIGLNKANFSTNSFQKRVMQQLVNDGKLAGTVSGTPD